MSNDTPKVNVDTTALLANIKSKATPAVAAVEVVPVDPAVEVVPTVVEAKPAAGSADTSVTDALIPGGAAGVATSKDQYQQYTASRVSTCLITPTGKRINFSNYQYYTKDPEIVRYLDIEIERGLTSIVKGKILTAEELNPEAAKRREIIEEFKASQEGRDFGNTKPESERSTALSTDGVAN